jgi:hypothetical protein
MNNKRKMKKNDVEAAWTFVFPYFKKMSFCFYIKEPCKILKLYNEFVSHVGQK